MKKGFLHTELIIDTKRFYPAQELFELMKQSLGDKYGTMYIKKQLTMDWIFIEGKDGFVSVWSSKWLSTVRGRITIGMNEPLSKIKLKLTIKDVLFYTLCVVTLGIAWVIREAIDILAGIFNLEGTKENRAMMKAIAEEIEKLVKE